MSEAAIKRARNVYANEKNINFIVDDILNSKLKENEFDYIFDRGCFHVLLSADRQRHITKIKQILKYNGMLFLILVSEKLLYKHHPNRYVCMIYLEEFCLELHDNFMTIKEGSQAKTWHCLCDR